MTDQTRSEYKLRCAVACMKRKSWETYLTDLKYNDQFRENLLQNITELKSNPKRYPEVGNITEKDWPIYYEQQEETKLADINE